VYEFAPGSVIVKDKHQHLCVGFTGPLLDFSFKRPPGMPVKPSSPALGDPFWMMDCVSCGAWRRFDAKPDENIGDCRSCDHPLEPRRAQECREPLGFRTNFRPRTDDESDGPSGRHRSIQAEGDEIRLTACGESNLAVRFAPGIRTYRINRGPLDPTAPGTWKGFSATAGQQKLSRNGQEALVEQQLIADNFLSGGDEPYGFRPYAGTDAARVDGIWIAAPKTTDALYLAPSTMPAGLGLDRVVGPRSLEGLGRDQMLRALTATAVRAAAISATFMLVNRAAIELDVDPEEFDVIEPRVVRPAGGAAVPLLQIADHLVNGAGFCAALGQSAPGSPPRIEGLLRSASADLAAYPLEEFLRGDHPAKCEQACYRCLLRYRNLPYHGLLDWRLGLAFLRALAVPSYPCGLRDGFDEPALADWQALVGQNVMRLQRQFSDTEARRLGPVWAVRFGKRPPWAVIAHPLWDGAAPAGVLQEACAELGGDPHVIVDSFNLARRPVTVRSAVIAPG
jgi:hypothetical protein